MCNNFTTFGLKGKKLLEETSNRQLLTHEGSHQKLKRRSERQEKTREEQKGRIDEVSLAHRCFTARAQTERGAAADDTCIVGRVIDFKEQIYPNIRSVHL